MSAHDIHARESERQVVQERLDARRTSANRNRLGQFATPNALAVEIAHYLHSLWDKDAGSVCFADPAVGTGSFYSAALTVFGTDRIERAVGVELDTEFAEAARNLWADSGLEVVLGDFTRVIASGLCPSRPNLILANPPYVRHHHITHADKERLRGLVSQMTRVEVNGLAGLYVYFLLLGTAWMEEGGLAAWLIPSEFMDVNYGAALKRFLTERVALIRLHRFDPDKVQFGDALVSSAVVIFRKTPPGPGHAVEFTFGGTLAKPEVSEAVPLDRLRESRKWTIHPKHSRNDRHTSGDGNGPMLADFLRIQRGIATGCNKFFVLDRAAAGRRGLPLCYLRPILPSPRHLKTTIIEADNDGYPRLDHQLCVIDCDLPEPLVKVKYPALWEYLRTADALGVRDGYLVGKRIPWYKQEQRAAAPFLCTYLGRGANQKRPFRFIWNRSDAIGTNLYLMLYPQKGLAAMLHQYPERDREVFNFLGQLTGHELRGEGRVYGGGLHKIEPSELGRVSAAALVERWPELAESVKRTDTPSLFD